MRKVKEVKIPDNPTDDQKKVLLERAYNYCIWHLGNGNKTIKQIQEKLENKGYTEEYIYPTLNKLIKEQYLDDKQYTESYIRYKLEEKGSQAIFFELVRKGVDKEIIKECLEQVDDLEEIEKEKAITFALKKALSYPKDLDKTKKMQRLVGALSRKGYSKDVFKIAGDAIKKAEEED